MKKKFILFTIFVCILSVKPLFAEEVKNDVFVSRAAICAEIRDHEPEGSDVSFPTSIGKVYFFTEIKGNESGKLKHIWYYKDKNIGEVELDYKPGRYRTWSYSEINPDLKGDWTVEAVINETTVLKRLVFKVE